MFKQGISLCMIANTPEVPHLDYRHGKGAGRVENPSLGFVLSGIEPNVDEMNLVDTTPENNLAERLGYRHEKLRIEKARDPLKPPNLSAYRNQSLEMATYNWIIVLDPDEEILNWRAIHSITNEDHDEAFRLSGKIIIYNPWIITSEGKTSSGRLFMNGKNHNFKRDWFEMLFKGEEYLKYLNVECDWLHKKL
jgi:hypothetical protein|tara:strand:+ start:407 stop:985 length:579 start_codon:yes stop_codon:yes gene_type:complete